VDVVGIEVVTSSDVVVVGKMEVVTTIDVVGSIVVVIHSVVVVVGLQVVVLRHKRSCAQPGIVVNNKIKPIKPTLSNLFIFPPIFCEHLHVT